MMSPNRSVLEVYGRKGKRDYVRVVREVIDGEWKIRVLWREGRRRTESFEDSRNGQREARAFADATHDRLKAPAPATFAPVTVRDLHSRYVLAKETEWAPNTLRLSNERFRDFELFVGRDTLATAVTRGHLDELKKALLAANRSPNQVRHILKEVVREFTWAVEWDVVAPTKLTNYTVKFAKAARRAAPQMAEYSRDERDRLIAAFDPRHPRQWRAWVLTTLLAYCGPRQSAARHIMVDDIELDPPTYDAAGTPTFVGAIRWRAETSKNDQLWRQPMPGPVAEAFWVALGWRQRDRYDGAFLFYGVQRRTRARALRRDAHDAAAKKSLEGVTIDEKPWTYSAYNKQLHDAEERAGVATIKYRAAHAHRRGIGGDVYAATGSMRAAADWLGDRSTKVVDRHYVLRRDEELRKLAQTVGAERTEMQQETKTGSDTTPEPATDDLNAEPAVGIEPTTARSEEPA